MLRPLPPIAGGGHAASTTVECVAQRVRSAAAAGGAFARSRALLALGPEPLPEAQAGLDGAPARFAANPNGVAKARHLLGAGPAGAVDDLTELCAAGLPSGLPGGLAALALTDREELLERVAVQQARRAALKSARALAATKQRKQGRMRSSGVYDRRAAKAAATASSIGGQTPATDPASSGMREGAAAAAARDAAGGVAGSGVNAPSRASPTNRAAPRPRAVDGAAPCDDGAPIPAAREAGDADGCPLRRAGSDCDGSAANGEKGGLAGTDDLQVSFTVCLEAVSGINVRDVSAPSSPAPKSDNPSTPQNHVIQL